MSLERLLYEPTPRTLDLDERQRAKYTRWIREEVRPYLERTGYDDEDCVPSSPITFLIHQTGLGDVVIAKLFVNLTDPPPVSQCDLSINDDNELIPDEWKEQ